MFLTHIGVIRDTTGQYVTDCRIHFAGLIQKLDCKMSNIKWIYIILGGKKYKKKHYVCSAWDLSISINYC